MRSAIAAALLIAATQAHAQVIPQPCAELAARENEPLPTTKADAVKAKLKILRLVIKRDPLARECWQAIKMEMRK